MSDRPLNLCQAAEHVHLDANELRHVAQRGEIEATEHGGDWWFEHRALDEWAQRNLLSVGRRPLEERYRSMVDEERRASRPCAGLAAILDPASVELALGAKGKAGVLRDLADLAERSGKVYDPEGLYRELADREEAASTAVGGGIAFPHPQFHDPYFFEETFVAYARSPGGVYFGAPDDEPTRHFFLVCATDHDRHMHILARLAMLAMRTSLRERLDAAEDVEGVIEAVKASEAELGR